MDMLGFADRSLFAKTMLYTSSHNLRDLLIKNIKVLDIWVEKNEKIVYILSHLCELLQPHAIFNCQIHVNSLPAIECLIQIKLN